VARLARGELAAAREAVFLAHEALHAFAKLHLFGRILKIHTKCP